MSTIKFKFGTGVEITQSIDNVTDAITEAKKLLKLTATVAPLAAKITIVSNGKEHTQVSIDKAGNVVTAGLRK